MSRCHVCQEPASDENFFVMDGREYPLCANDGSKLGYHLGNMLSAELNRKAKENSPKKGKNK